GAFLRCGEHNIALPLALSDICSVMLQMTMRGRRLRFLPVALALAGSLAFAQAELPWNRSEGAEARSWQALAPSVVVACLPGSCEASVSPEVVSVGLGSIGMLIGLLLAGMVFGRNIAGFLDSLDSIES
ncbi:unnamed protein product, partial [Effrenium voratum]